MTYDEITTFVGYFLLGALVASALLAVLFAVWELLAP